MNYSQHCDFLWQLHIIYQGGGDVLQKFLDTASNYQANSLIYVEPGAYDPPKNNISKNNLSVVGTGTFPDETIIRGIYWDAPLSDIGRSWITNNTSLALLSNITLSACTVINASGYSQIANNINNCNIFDCSSIMSSNNTTPNQTLAQYGTLRNCHLSGCTGFAHLVRYGDGIYDCNIHDMSFGHNTAQVGTLAANTYRTYFHHCKTNSNVFASNSGFCLHF